jgi:hypothetical protein
VASTTTTPVASARVNPGRDWHRARLLLAWALAAGLIAALSLYGFSYYRLGLEERPLSPLHSRLRPSGTIGLRLGMLGFGLYCVLFLYPLRKRWRWLSMIGKTRHWLDFHVLAGITAPILITFHASFKLQGLAGAAYWIMIAVALSGFVGRYIYAQIPRSLNTTQLTMSEIQTQAEDLAGQLARQNVFRPEDLAPLLHVPAPAEIRRMSFGSVLWTMIRMDLARPIRVSRLRRRVLKSGELFTTLGGLLASQHADLETIISAARRQSWLRAKAAFLGRTQRVFHLWHVIHRPFSYSFALLVTVHIGVVLLMGYF